MEWNFICFVKLNKEEFCFIHFIEEKVLTAPIIHITKNNNTFFKIIYSDLAAITSLCQRNKFVNKQKLLLVLILQRHNEGMNDEHTD